MVGTDEYSELQMILAFEYGYKQHEKGNNFDKAKELFLKDLKGGD